MGRIVNILFDSLTEIKPERSSMLKGALQGFNSLSELNQRPSSEPAAYLSQ